MTAEVTTGTDTGTDTGTTTMNEPKSTLYVSNIDWKIKKPLLRRALHTLFSRHGKVRTNYRNYIILYYIVLYCILASCD